MILRPYQNEAVDATALALAEHNRALIVCPTGGGKTVVSAEIIRRITATRRRTLFLAHRRELIKQTAAKLSDFGVPCGVVMAGVRPSSGDLVQVASIQTLARRSLSNDPDFIFFDEAHHVTDDNQYGQLIERYPNAKIIGLTATPWRLDGRGLADIFPRYVITRTPAQLRREGYLAPVTGWVFRALDTSSVAVRGGDFVQSQLAHTENNIVGDVVEEWIQRVDNVRTILFAASVAHSKQFVDAFRARGVAAEHVDGETPTSERDAIIDRVRRGETLILSNCNVATEGFDLPELTCCILARPTLSVVLYLQMVGRVLRPAPGKRYAIIHDHANCLTRHGEPYDEAREYVPTTSRMSRRADAGLPALVRCAKCGAITLESPCPACGYERPESERGTPVIITEAEAVSLESVAEEQQNLSALSGTVFFKKVGTTVVGIFERVVDGEGAYGPEKHYWFRGARGSFCIPAPTDLRQRLIAVQVGDTCRIVYTGTTQTKYGNAKKSFRVFIKPADSVGIKPATQVAP